MMATAELLFFFSSRRRHTRWPRVWSSDVCSSDLATPSACSSAAGCLSAVCPTARATIHESMSALTLLAPEPLAGKTAVACGLARRIASEGKRVSLQRIPGDDHAENDEVLFSGLKGVTQDSTMAESTLIEAPAGDRARSLADFPDGRAVVITDASTPMGALADYCREAGDRLAGAVINKTPARRADSLLADAKAAGINVLRALPEDRLLAAPVIRDVVQ